MIIFIIFLDIFLTQFFLLAVFFPTGPFTGPLVCLLILSVLFFTNHCLISSHVLKEILVQKEHILHFHLSPQFHVCNNSMFEI